MLRKLRYIFEGTLLLLVFGFFRVLPLDVASALGGWIARLIGPFTRGQRTAEKNISQALPEYDARQRKRIISEMWENLGRLVGEYPHLPGPAMAKRITVEGREHLEKIVASGKGALFISGHFANWEIAPLTAALCDFPMVLIYRAPNNPVVDWAIHFIRSHYNKNLYNKGRDAAKESIRALKNHEAVAMLADQKMNDGAPAPFFGRNAMTPTAPAQLAIKFQVPVVMVRVVRTDGAHFHVSALPPLTYDRSTDSATVMTDINRHFEEWIRSHPAQWLWVHNRWGNPQ